MKGRRRAIFAILVLALSVVSGTVESFASGKSEDPLSEARRLLSEGRLSDALTLNMDVFLHDAEQKDAVLTLLDGILNKSKEFNQTIERFAAIDFSRPVQSFDCSAICGSAIIWVTTWAHLALTGVIRPRIRESGCRLQV